MYVPSLLPDDIFVLAYLRLAQVYCLLGLRYVSVKCLGYLVCLVCLVPKFVCGTLYMLVVIYVYVHSLLPEDIFIIAYWRLAQFLVYMAYVT